MAMKEKTATRSIQAFAATVTQVQFNLAAWRKRQEPVPKVFMA
jgi:hypothetical protein